VKTFATEPDTQAEVADAACALVTEYAPRLQAAGEVLVSDDGLRVVLVWRWAGGHGARLLREGELVRDAMHEHPAFAKARPLDARVLRPRDGGMSL
jgi:ribonuclease D